MTIETQKYMAASILKVGKNRIWFDPDTIEEVEAAVTREDVRKLINDGIIQPKRVKGVSRARANKVSAQKAKGRRRGHGSRKGKSGSRFPKKRRWISTIRALRNTLKELRSEGKLGVSDYRKLYRKAKGGIFKNKGHLMSYAQENKIIKE